MKILGFEIPFFPTRQKALSAVDASRGWFRILEPFSGAWQHNQSLELGQVLAHPTVFSCQTLIASDIAKLRLKLMGTQNGSGIWIETRNPAYSPVLRKPNHFQTRQQFIESWVLSKLQRGNAIVLKQRDRRGVVVGMHVLDWQYVRPLVADNGDVFYELNTDGIARLAGMAERVVVPAREIIHDRYNCLFHPLVGLSPIFAAGLPAAQGLAIQKNATSFFGNASMPGGILMAPGAIDDATAERIKAKWTERFSGENAGKIALLADGLKYEPTRTNAVDSQLIEQLRWSAETICSTYHVPAFMAGVGSAPVSANLEADLARYYSQALQGLMEAVEALLDEGLGVGEQLGVEFDLDGLIRMDTTAQVLAIKDAVGAGVMAPNEGRRKLNLPPVEGGESPLMQQQNFSLEALARRDARPDPFATEPRPAPAPAPAPEERRTKPDKIVSARAIRRRLRAITMIGEA